MKAVYYCLHVPTGQTFTREYMNIEGMPNKLLADKLNDALCKWNASNSAKWVYYWKGELI